MGGRTDHPLDVGSAHRMYSNRSAEKRKSWQEHAHKRSVLKEKQLA